MPAVKKLSVVVPYRDREEHLRQFVPHICTFLQKNLPAVPVRIDVVEQCGEAPFNRGKLINCGFDIVQKDVDYVVFHDVDYLPVEADYGYTTKPTRLIWHGLTLKEDYENFFGAVCGMAVGDFSAVNGFSNEFWHWGCEDVDLRLRIQSCGLTIERRDGEFRSLQHVHNGFRAPGELRSEVLPNFRRLQRVWNGAPGSIARAEGLSTLDYKLEKTVTLFSAGGGNPNAYLHRVHIGEPIGHDLG